MTITNRHAFTLVELMIAVALSLVVMLLAFASFRMAAKAISHLNRVATENELFRQGVTQAIDDADFWNAEANPQFPYGRAYMAFQNVDENGNRLPDVVSGAVYDHGANKRPFRRVSYVGGSAEDPGWLLPHDPRCWYRNGVYSNPRPLQPDYINRTGTSTSMRLWAGDNSSPNWDTSGPNSLVPLPWTPRHIWGDYAETSSMGDVPTASATDVSSWRGSRPQLMAKLFSELGPIGIANYLPPGTMTLFLRPSTNLYAAPFNDANSHFDKGEVPWQLDRPKFLSQNNSATYNQSEVGRWSSTVDRPTAGQVSGRNRLNYMEGLQIWFTLTARDLACANNQRSLLYGARISNGAFPWATITETTRQGWSRDLIENVGGNSANALVSWVASRQANDYRNDTYLVPPSLTSSPNPTAGDRPPTLPLLRVSSYRYRLNGGDICNLAVRVSEPSSGRIMDLGFSVFGTSYRGARQHWALRTWGQVLAPGTHRLVAGDPDMPAMGDWYR